MALTVATNTGALAAQAAASSVNREMETSMQRLSSGKRINSAADDAAGSAIVSRLTSEIKGTNMAIRNALDAQALINTAEGAHVEVEAILQRMRELAVQSSNDTNGDQDRQNLQLEMTSLSNEIDKIAGATSWAGINLLDGATPNASSLATSHSDKKSLNFNIGSGTSVLDSMTVNIGAVSTAAIGIGGGTSVPSTVVATTEAGTAGSVSVGSSTPLSHEFTFAGSWAAGDTYTTDLNGVTVSIIAADADGYSNDMEGLARQFSDEVATLAALPANTGKLNGLEVSRTGQVVKVAFKNTSTPGVDIALANASITNDSNTDGSIDITTANQIAITDATSDTGTIFSVDINGVTFTVTQGSDYAGTTVFTDNAAGAAAALAAKINADAAAANGNLADSGIVATSSGGTVSLTQTLTNANTSTTNAGTGIALAQNTTTGVFTLSGVVAVGDKVELVIEGTKVEAEVAASDGYANDLAGTIQLLKKSIEDAGISNVTVSNVTGTTFTLEKSNAIDITTVAAAKSTISAVDSALQVIASQRASLGAFSNRLESTVTNLTNVSNNLQAGRGRIEDADFASETTNLAKTQILQQASMAMLAQANAAKQNVLSLLQG